MSVKSLPVEVMSIICSHVQILERKMLRLRCRTLCTTSSGAFFDRYFKSIHFMVTSDSLGRLEDLAQSDEIRKRVQELWIIPTVFEGVHQLGENNMGEYRESSKSCQPLDGDELRDRYHTYKAMITDNSDLLNSHVFSARLSKCMNQFDNLDAVGLARYTTTFLLDPRQRKVRFLGWRHLIDRIDFRSTPSTPDRLQDIGDKMRKVKSLAFSSLLQALSWSNRKIRRLHTCDPNYCADVSSQVTLPEVQCDYRVPFLDSVEDLHLCIDLGRDTWVKLVTKLSPGLKRLRLSQSVGHPSQAQPYFFKDICERGKFIQLKCLHLIQAQITSESLKSMLTTAKQTLAILKLTRVRLIDEINSITGDLNSSQRNVSNIPRVDDPGHSQSRYRHPPRGFYNTPRIPRISPSSPLFSLSAPFIRPAVGTPPVPRVPPPPRNTYAPISSTMPSSPTVPQAPLPPTNLYSLVPSTTPTNPYTSPLITSHNYVPTPPIPTGQEDIIWKGLWTFFSNELSLQKFKMAEIGSGRYRVWLQGTEGDIRWTRPAVFNAQEVGSSFREWIDQFTPRQYLEMPDSDERNNDMGKQSIRDSLSRLF